MALVIEVVHELVPNDGSDGAERRRVVADGVEQRRLEKSRREYGLVELTIAIGVERLREHEPLVAIDRPTDLAELPLELECGRALGVAERIVPSNRDRQVIPEVGTDIRSSPSPP